MYMVKIQKHSTTGNLWVFIPQEQRRALDLKPGDKVKVVVTREDEVK